MIAFLLSLLSCCWQVSPVPAPWRNRLRRTGDLRERCTGWCALLAW